jgi:hypothetical protein
MKKRLGDKTPKHTLHIDYLSTAFSDSRFIHLVRDLRDVARSILSAGWERKLSDAAERWKRYVSTALSHENHLQERYIGVRFESLLENSEEVMRRLCSFLDLEYCPIMVRPEEFGADSIPKVHFEQHPDLFSSNARPIDSSKAYSWRKK